MDFLERANKLIEFMDKAFHLVEVFRLSFDAKELCLQGNYEAGFDLVKKAKALAQEHLMKFVDGLGSTIPVFTMVWIYMETGRYTDAEPPPFRKQEDF